MKDWKENTLLRRTALISFLLISPIACLGDTCSHFIRFYRQLFSLIRSLW